MREGLDNKFSCEFYQKAAGKHLRKKRGKQYEGEKKKNKNKKNPKDNYYIKNKENFI